MADENTEIDLGLDILERQGGTTTSMGDLYGYPVFSESFSKKIAKQKELEKEELDIAMDSVFYESPVDDLELSYQTVMQAEMVAVVKEDISTQKETKDSIPFMVGFTLMGALLTTGVWMLIEKYKRRKSKSVDKNYHK